MDKDRTDALTNLVRTMTEGLGLVLWGVEFASAGRRPVLRIYVDSRDPEAGATIDQCAAVSRHVGVGLEAEDLAPGSYILEVSSPGLERPFFRLEQLGQYVGREISVSLKAPLAPEPGSKAEGRKNFKGTLAKVEGPCITMADKDGRNTTFVWEQVKKAHLVHRFETSSKKPKGRKG